MASLRCKACAAAYTKLPQAKGKAMPDSAGDMFELPSDKAWLNFMTHKLPVLREQGWEPAAEADPHDIPGLVAAVERILLR